MKRKLFLTILVAGTVLFSSCDHEPNFPGLDELSQPTNLQKYTLDYVGAAFTADAPAKDALPAWLKTKYYSCDKGSFATVNYQFVQSVPEYVSAISHTKSYALTAADYQVAWGAGSSINYFSPSKPAKSFLPGILASAITDPTEGMLAAVNYNQADEDGVQPAFNGDFESNSFIGWENTTTVGTYKWQVKAFAGNHFAQQSAFNHKAGTLESYLIAAKPISIKDDMVFSFDAIYCNYREEGGRISVLVTTNLAGFTPADIAAATWEDITSNFTIATSLNNVGDPTPVKEFSLNKYAGKSIYVAFKYVGDGTADVNETSTIRLDKVVVKNASQAPVAHKEVTSLYKYTGTAWAAYTGVDILQPSDYKAMGVENLTSSSAQTYLPVYLSMTYPYATSGTVKAVAFQSPTSYMAAEFQKSTTAWVSTSAPVELTDEYEYNGTDWVYVRTVPKAALNETFDGRTVTDNDKTMLAGWTNVALQGTLTWIDKKYSGNNYTQCSAFGAASGGVEAWLITPELEVKDNYVFKFDMVSGYWVHDGLHIYISTNFSGKEDGIASATWVDITSNFEFPKNASGYSKFTPVGPYKLDAYVGQKVYIGFKYLGDKDKGETSTVQLDNIYVGE